MCYTVMVFPMMATLLIFTPFLLNFIVVILEFNLFAQELFTATLTTQLNYSSEIELLLSWKMSLQIVGG